MSCANRKIRGNVYSIWTNFAAIGLIYSIISPLMLIFISAVFVLFYIAYRHNYYYVQKNKVDTHGLLFDNALSQLFAGVYIMEITLIGLFFIVRNTADNVACTPQAIIMIVALCLTAAYHFVLEQTMAPVSELIPVTLEDKAVEAEEKLLLAETRGRPSSEMDQEAEDAGIKLPDVEIDRKSKELGHKLESGGKENAPAKSGRGFTSGLTETAENARKTMTRLNRRIAAMTAPEREHLPLHAGVARRIDVGNQLGEALSRYPDELTDLSPAERQAELRAAYQDPITREPTPIVWIPQDAAGISDDSVKRVKKYGRHLQYSNSGAFLTAKNHCEVVQPAPDLRSDSLLDWVL